MLAEIHAKNFILFDEIEMELSDKMNVITGESGSGKSLFLSILKSLHGEKNEFVTGASEIEARFIVEEGEFVVNLKINNSRTSARINDSMVTIAQLRDHVQRWMDIHTQGISQVLKNSQIHTHFVDLFSPSLNELVHNYTTLFEDYLKLSKFLKENDHEKLQLDIEEIANEIERIEKFFVTDVEYESIKEKYKKLSNIEEILKISKELDYLISGESGIESSIERIYQKLREIQKLDGEREFLKIFDEISILLKEYKRNFLEYVDSLQFDQEEFLGIEEKIIEMEKIRRKYGPTFEDVGIHLNELKQKYEKLHLVDSEIKSARDKFTMITRQMEDLCAKIKETREHVAHEFVEVVNENLKSLSMQDAHLSFLHEDTQFTSIGKDRIEFTGAMNPGMPELPLSKIASGGEISRFYLAIEAVLSGKLPISTIVFDEIESGIGLRTADVVAKKMKEISQNTQIIVITHMPQIAVVADKHFKVEKHQSANYTYSIIKEINGEEREAEITEMFGKISGLRSSY